MPVIRYLYVKMPFTIPQNQKIQPFRGYPKRQWLLVKIAPAGAGPPDGTAVWIRQPFAGQEVIRYQEETKRICGRAEHRTSNVERRTSNLEAGRDICRPS